MVVCGDLNVAHNEIDLRNPETNRRSAGFTDEGVKSSRCSWTRDFRTAFAFSTPIPLNTVGGLTERGRERGMPAGA